MKCGGKTLVLVLSGIALGTTVQALVATGVNPYNPIIERNVFALKPPPRPEDLRPPPPPVPKITLTGITTILGNKRALMKVAVPAKPPEPAHEESYILTEGQRDGDIEVVTIDEKAATVKVINHGIEQLLDFDKNGAKPNPGAAIAGAPPGAIPTSIPLPPPSNPGLRQIPQRLPRTPSSTIGEPSSAGVQPGSMGINMGGGVANQTSQDSMKLTPEEQTVLIEAQRAKLLDQGDTESASLFPPTELSPQ